MKRHCFKICLITITLCYLQACSNIKQPIASVALVNMSKTQNIAVVPKQLQSALSSKQTTTRLTVNNVVYDIQPQYSSATGNICRKANSSRHGLKVYCQIQDGRWVQISQIIANYDATTEVNTSAKNNNTSEGF